MSTAISIEHESRAVGRLVEILEQEQGYLINADIDQIQPLLEEKSTLLQSLNASSQERYQWLSAAGFTANESGMSEWLKQSSEDALQTSWLTMQQALFKAKELNRVNGMLINKHFTRNQQLLSTLQGQTEVDNFYGPNGQATSKVRMRGAILG
jgi:flagella synthesis protein FlgN